MSLKRPGPMPDGGAGTLLEASVVLIAVVASLASALAFRRPKAPPSPEQKPPVNDAESESAEVASEESQSIKTSR